MNDGNLKKAYVFGNILINIVKWLLLISMVTVFGFTLGLIVFVLIYGNKIPLDLFNKFARILLPFTQTDFNELLTNHGLKNLVVAVVGYGVASSLTGFMSYLLADRSVNLYKSITIGDIFTRSANKLVDEMIGISFINTFTMPILILVISLKTNIFLDEYITVGFGGLIFLIVLFVIKILINRGLNISKDNTKYDRLIQDYKADIDELKIQSIKRDSELKKLKVQIKEQEEKIQQKEVKKKKTVKKTTNK